MAALLESGRGAAVGATALELGDTVSSEVRVGCELEESAGNAKPHPGAKSVVPAYRIDAPESLERHPVAARDPAERLAPANPMKRSVADVVCFRSGRSPHGKRGGYRDSGDHQTGAGSGVGAASSGVGRPHLGCGKMIAGGDAAPALASARDIAQESGPG